jgi:hypothetical protein
MSKLNVDRFRVKSSDLTVKKKDRSETAKHLGQKHDQRSHGGGGGIQSPKVSSTRL